MQQNPLNNKRGIRYLCLCPGFTDTTMFDSRWSDEDKEAPPGIDETSKKAAIEHISKIGVNS